MRLNEISPAARKGPQRYLTDPPRHREAVTNKRPGRYGGAWLPFGQQEALHEL